MFIRYWLASTCLRDALRPDVGAQVAGEDPLVDGVELARHIADGVTGGDSAERLGLCADAGVGPHEELDL